MLSHTPEIAGSRVRRGIARKVGGLLAAGTVGIGACAYLPPAFDGEQRCNGHGELCERRVDEVVFAGTHHSMSAARSGWMFRNHDRGIAARLAAGYRALLIDTHYWNSRAAVGWFRRKFSASYQPVLDNVLGRIDRPRAGAFLCHGVCRLGAAPLAEELAAIADLLHANPHEIVILSIEDYVTSDDTDAAFRESGLLPLVFTPDGTGEWPTLRELIERDERVIVLADHHGGTPDWYMPFRTTTQDTPFDFRDPSEFSCGRNRGSANAPLLLINHWIAAMPPNPMWARRVNRYDVIMERVEQCRAARGTEPTIIAVDFFSIGDVRRAVDDLNLRLRK